MKSLHSILNIKNKDYFISALVSGLCVVILITMKIAENKSFENYVEANISSSNLETSDDSSEVFSHDQEYYDNFIGLPASDLFENLESSFWEILDTNDNYATYQNGNGNTITIYYNESQIIENIDILEME